MARPIAAERPSLSRAASESDDATVQIVWVGPFDFGGDDLADAQRPAAGEVDRAVDLGRVCPGTTLRHGRSDFVDDDLLARTDLALQAMRRDLLLSRHQRVPALLLDLVRHGVAECIRGCAGHRLVFEAADTVDPGLLEPVEQAGEIGIGFTGEADDEGRAQRQLRALFAPFPDAPERLVLRRRPFHGLEDFRARMLKGNVEIGQDFACPSSVR